MFDLRAYYAEDNQRVQDKYVDSLQLIREICSETEGFGKAHGKKEYYRFINHVGNFILRLAEYERNVGNDYFSTKSFEELLKKNNELYTEVLDKNYQNSYANPSYCVTLFGDRFGQLISYYYCEYRQYIFYALYHKIFKMEEYNRLLGEVFDCIKHSHMIDYDALRKLIVSPQRKNKTRELRHTLREQFDKDFSYLRDIFQNRDLSDLRYLLRYGKYITENEIKTAKFLMQYHAAKVRRLSIQIVNAYVNGFKRDNKDISIKSTVGLIYNIGQERITQQLLHDLKAKNLEIVINRVLSSKTNKQYIYDHRFDAALYLDEDYTASFQKDFREAGESCKNILSMYSGTIFLDAFGEPSFIPENKKECLRFTDEQQTLFRTHQDNVTRITDKYLPRGEVSFTIISFPSPEIGENYEHLFEDILEVNMLDTERYEGIQQKIIDVLDKADVVHIKGKGENRTDMKVMMHMLKNPERETNFQNCGADLNIPIGEVYTSPQLKGTHGVLHVDEAFLRGLKFIDLELIFEDGYVVSYNCGNFKDAEDNKRYIEENLLFPHKTLPLGEFAIGTNTLAYMIAKKYKILNILPILIIEKMGPHFAIGDTCFVMNEDRAVFNRLDNKEIVARENEKTALRKTNMREAYTHRHTDITLPYESIEFITAVTKDNKTLDIIRDGRFVLKGTQELNKPFEQ